MARHNTLIHPVTRLEHDAELRTAVVRTIGYSWRCSCEARGRIRSDWRTARAEALEHRRASQGENAHGG